MRVLRVSEKGTSATCGGCGHYHTSLGSAKVFKCPRCNYCAPRDPHGARNILLRALAEGLLENVAVFDAHRTAADLGLA